MCKFYVDEGYLIKPFTFKNISTEMYTTEQIRRLSAKNKSVLKRTKHKNYKRQINTQRQMVPLKKSAHRFSAIIVICISFYAVYKSRAANSKREPGMNCVALVSLFF